jgi:short-subunit dehydrogenase
MSETRSEVVVITGASAGVGRAIVRAFAARKASIGLIARDRERLEAAQREVEDCGGRALVLPLDVADAQAVEAAGRTVLQTFGPIDVWVNCAMTTIFAPLDEITPDEFKRATEVTYLGFVYGTMTALKQMLPRNHGTILQVGSALAYRSIPLQSAYCGAKHAMVGFTDSLRSELIHKKSKVHVTVVHLPGMNTPQFSWCRTRLPRQPQPVAPIYQPEVAGEAIYAAAHQRRREIFVGAPTVAAIYGQSFAPGLADWYLGKTNVDAQQTSDPIPADRPDNLFEPVPGPYAARGIFTNQASNFSLQTWATINRKPVAAALGVLALAGALLSRRSARNS